MIPTLLRRSMSGILVFVLSATAASPHHSFSAVYDDKRAVTVSGVVTQFRFVNPHAMLHLDVTDDSGKVASGSWSSRDG